MCIHAGMKRFTAANKSVKVRSILSFALGVVMVCGLLAQMWNLFHQFVSGLKTVAVSYENKDELEFPSFAFCDSRGFRRRAPLTANAGRYNATTFNLEEEVSLKWLMNPKIDILGNSYTAELLPTVVNGYCMLFEFQRDYPLNTFVGK